MGNRANPTVIGAFVVGAVALVVAGLLVFGGLHLFSRPQTFVLYFDTTVTGLSVGSPVEFRGVKLGQVSGIHARWGSEWITVLVQLEFSGHRGARGGLDRADIQHAIDKGLRAQLSTLSFLTGQLYVALDYFPGTPARLVRLDPGYPEIPTVPTQLQQIGERMDKFFKAVEALPLDKLMSTSLETVEGINSLARSPELQTTLRGAADFLADADRLTRRLDKEAGPLLVSARDTSEAARAAFDQIAQDTRRALGQIERELDMLSAVLKDAQRVLQSVDTQVVPLAASVTSTAEEARATLERARLTLAEIDGTLDGDSGLGYQLGQTLQELRAASRSLRVLSDYLERHPETLLWGKGRPRGN